MMISSSQNKYPSWTVPKYLQFTCLTAQACNWLLTRRCPSLDCNLLEVSIMCLFSLPGPCLAGSIIKCLPNETANEWFVVRFFWSVGYRSVSSRTLDGEDKREPVYLSFTQHLHSPPFLWGMPGFLYGIHHFCVTEGGRSHLPLKLNSLPTGLSPLPLQLGHRHVTKVPSIRSTYPLISEYWNL